MLQEWFHEPEESLNPNQGPNPPKTRRLNIVALVSDTNQDIRRRAVVRLHESKIGQAESNRQRCLMGDIIPSLRARGKQDLAPSKYVVHHTEVCAWSLLDQACQQSREVFGELSERVMTNIASMKMVDLRLNVLHSQCSAREDARPCTGTAVCDTPGKFIQQASVVLLSCQSESWRPSAIRCINEDGEPKPQRRIRSARVGESWRGRAAGAES